jgi:hypothetical protein
MTALAVNLVLGAYGCGFFKNNPEDIDAEDQGGTWMEATAETPVSVPICSCEEGSGRSRVLIYL